jgi:hypothetical protein
VKREEYREPHLQKRHDVTPLEVLRVGGILFCLLTLLAYAHILRPTNERSS